MDFVREIFRLFDQAAHALRCDSTLHIEEAQRHDGGFTQRADAAVDQPIGLCRFTQLGQASLRRQTIAAREALDVVGVAQRDFQLGAPDRRNSLFSSRKIRQECVRDGACEIFERLGCRLEIVDDDALSILRARGARPKADHHERRERRAKQERHSWRISFRARSFRARTSHGLGEGCCGF